MAIAPDSTSSGLVGLGNTTLTVSHTCAGSDRILWVGVLSGTTSRPFTVTYNGVAMASVGSLDNNGYASDLYYLFAPDVGTHDIVFTLGGVTSLLDLSAASYTGVAARDTQTFTTFPAGPSTGSNTLFPNVDNCWVVGCATGSNGANFTVNSGTFNPLQGVFGTFDQIRLFDIGPVTPPSNQTLDVNAHGSSFINLTMASFTPSGGGPIWDPSMTCNIPLTRVLDSGNISY